VRNKRKVQNAIPYRVYPESRRGVIIIIIIIIFRFRFRFRIKPAARRCTGIRRVLFSINFCFSTGRRSRTTLHGRVTVCPVRADHVIFVIYFKSKQLYYSYGTQRYARGEFSFCRESCTRRTSGNINVDLVIAFFVFCFFLKKHVLFFVLSRF